MDEFKERTPEEHLPMHYQRVLALIGEGSDNPSTVSYIANLTGLGSTLVRATVSDLIVSHGFPIGTSNSSDKPGYYLIVTDEERDNTVRNLRSRAMKILKRARVIEQISNKDQIDLGL